MGEPPGGTGYSAGKGGFGPWSPSGKEETCTMSKEVPKETSSNPPPAKQGTCGRDIPNMPRGRGKILLVSLVRCDALGADMAQRHMSGGPHLSPRGSKALPSSTACVSKQDPSTLCTALQAPTQSVPQGKSRALSAAQRGKETRYFLRSHWKKTFFPKSPVVSLVRCDDLWGDKSQKHTALSPVPSQVEAKAAARSGGRHTVSSVSEGGGEKTARRKAVRATLLPLPPSVTEEDACSNQQEGPPAQPAARLSTRLTAVTKKARHSRPQTSEVPRGGSACSDNGEDPGEGPSKPRSAGATDSSRPRDLRLGHRKRKQESQDVSRNVPQGQPPVRGSRAKGHVTAKEKKLGRGKGRASQIASHRGQRAIQRGTLVWFKFQDYPYWPAVVVAVWEVDKVLLAKVLLIEAFMQEEWRAIQVPVRRLKHFDCEQKDTLAKRARKLYGPSVDWCCSVVAHYRRAVSHGSFEGSFLEYFAADISFPVRKDIQQGDLDGTFPRVNYDQLEDLQQMPGLGGQKPCKRLLPDRTKAARDRDNQKFLDFIVKRKGAESHLLDIVSGRKRSTWLDSFVKAKKRPLYFETYLEDDQQLDVLVAYLQGICGQVHKKILRLIRNDTVNFLLEVLLPEAIICSISALEGLEYKDAQEKFKEGPPVHEREKELFDRKVIAERRRKLSQC